MTSQTRKIITFSLILCLTGLVLYVQGDRVYRWLLGEQNKVRSVGRYAAKNLWTVSKRRTFVRFDSLKGKPRIIGNLRKLDQDTADIHVRLSVRWNHDVLRRVIERLRAIDDPSKSRQFQFLYTLSGDHSELNLLKFHGNKQDRRAWRDFRGTPASTSLKDLTNLRTRRNMTITPTASFINRTRVVALDDSGGVVRRSPYVVWGRDLHRKYYHPYGSYSWLRLKNLSNDQSLGAELIAFTRQGFIFELVISDVDREQFERIKSFDVPVPQVYYRGKWRKQDELH